jgi:general secretion pathway protein D
LLLSQFDLPKRKGWGRVLRSVSRAPLGHGLARLGAAAICFVVVGAPLAACNLTSLGQPEPTYNANEPPDAADQVRAADLQPRFPASTETVNTATRPAVRPYVYYGTGAENPRTLGAQSTSDGSGYELNFENTPIATVTKVILGDILGVGYTIDARVQGTITLASGRPIPKTDVLYALESALRTANAVLVRDQSGYRLLPAADAVGGGATDRAMAGKGPEPGYGITIIPLQYVSVQTVSKLLDSFATKPGSIRADPARNLLVVQGSGAERRAAVETVLNFDADWMHGQSVGIYPVKNTTPEPIIGELEKIMDTGEGGLSQNLVKLQPIARLNAILAVTRKPELLRSTESWIKRLDNSETASAGVKVYRVRFGDARQIAKILNELFLGAQASSGEAATNQIAPGGGTTTLSSTERLTGGASAPTVSGVQPPGIQSPRTTGLPPADNIPSASPAGSLGGGRAGAIPGILPDVRITPDVVNNALLIYASQENYRIIQRALDQIDRPQLQVAVEATIAEVTLNDNLNYGVQFFLQNTNLGFNSPVGSAINTAASSPLAAVFPGFNFLVGAQASPQVLINALHTYTDVKVLSNPSLVVVDNQPATLEVGDQVPTTTGSATVLSSSNTVVNTIDYHDTGIILRVTPRISPNGSILLNVEQEISNVSTTSNTGTLTPTFSTRKVKSAISIVSGQTVLLAGLISDSQSRTRNGIPLVDEIPGLDFFGSQTQKQLQRTELIIFIRPQIIRDSVDASVVAEELRARLRGSKVGSVRPPGAVTPEGPHAITGVP